MIATKELELTREEAQTTANEYISNSFGQTFFAGKGTHRDDGWRFMVQCHFEEIKYRPAAGFLTVFENGQVEQLSEDRIRDMKEIAEVQAAKKRGKKFARDENGVVLRCHARIKANRWTTNHIDHKVGARGGIFVPVEPPIWRFAIKDSLVNAMDAPLDVIDVNAITGEVLPLTEHQIDIIAGGLSAARRLKKQAATA